VLLERRQMFGTCRNDGRPGDRDEAAAHRFYGLPEARVDTENPVRIENAGFRSVPEIIIVSTMSPLSSPFWLRSPPRFGPVPPSRLRSLLSAIRSPSFNKARHVAYAFGNLTDCCGFGCPVSGRACGTGCTT
jgi:hypothetical protein